MNLGEEMGGQVTYEFIYEIHMNFPDFGESKSINQLLNIHLTSFYHENKG